MHLIDFQHRTNSTVNTPHSGTQIANLLEGILELFPDLAYWMTLYQHNPIGGAVHDLRMDSEALWNTYWGLNGETQLNQNLVPSHSIQTTSTIQDALGWWNLVIFLISEAYDIPLDDTVDGMDFFLTNVLYGEEHDVIVPITSQDGGCSHGTIFPYQWHVGSTANPGVINHIIELLKLEPIEEDGAFSLDGFHPETLNFGLMPNPLAQTGAGTVAITEPASGLVVTPGTSLDVAIAGTGDVEKNLFYAGNPALSMYAETQENQSPTFTYHIPQEAFGKIHIGVAGFNQQGLLDTDTAFVVVTPDAALDSISAEPDVLYVPVGGVVSFLAKGHFSDGVDRWLTYHDDLTYEVGEETAATFIEPGTLLGLAADTTIAVVHFQQFTDTAIVIVTSSDIVLDAQPEQFQASVNGGNFTISVTSNVTWAVASSDTFLQIQPYIGVFNQAVSFTCKPNLDTVQRTAIITLTAAGGLTKEVVLTQDGIHLSIAPVFIEALPTGGELPFSISSNTNWEIQGFDSWVVPSDTSGSGDSLMAILCEPNPDESPRQDTFFIVAGGVLSRTVVVSQPGMLPTLDVSPGSFFFEASGGEDTLYIMSNTDWQILPPDWLFFDLSAGTGDTVLTIICPPNSDMGPRTDTVTVIAGGLSQKIPVYQDGITSIPPLVPTDYSLEVHPNPFHKATNISFTLPTAQSLRLEILDFSGRRSAVLAKGEYPAGEHTLSWNPEELPPGIYLCRLIADRAAAIRIILQ